MNLVRKRKSSSLKGGPDKYIRTEKPQSTRPPASYNASSPLTTEASGIVTTSKEERGLEVHGTSSPWRRSPRFKSQGLLGQVHSADLVAEGQVENEEEAVQCSPAHCPPQTEEDTDTDLVITMDERHGGGRKGSRKKGGVKRKKRAADGEVGYREQEGAGPEVEIDRELDRELENKSRQHNLTTANVRNIIHEVITNEHVVAMMKAAINETEAVPVFEPKMTRSKFKEVVEKGVVIPTWNISPIKNAQQFVDIQLAEEDSSDEEYCPDEEEEDETAEDTFQESDMESTASSPRGTRGGFHRKINTEWDDDRSCSPMQVNRSRSRHLRVEVVPMGPPPPPQPSSSSGPQGFYTTRTPPEFSFLEKLHAVEEELAIGPVCLEPYQPPLADGLMACRTRSKRPLRDVPMGQLEAELRAPDITPDMYGCGSAPEDPEWTHWLQGIMTSNMYNDEEGDDDDDDPEYNFLAEIDEPDVEDYRNDRAVRITKKEVNQLMEELFETFQDEMTAQEQDGEGHEEEEEREEEAPSLGTPALETPIFNTLPDILLEEPMAEMTAGCYCTVKEQLDAIRRRRALLESQGLLVPSSLIPKPREPPPPFTPTLSHQQGLQLQQQVQQHVQLLTQVHMLTSPVAALQSEAAATKQFLMELQMFAQRGELTRGPVEPGFTSVFRACNLEAALSLLEELRLSPIPYQEAPNKPRTCRRVRKHPSMPPQLAWLFATRPVFLYPELLPHVSLDPALHSARSVSMFTAGEDCLIVLGLRNLGETLQPKELLCHYLLRAKRVSQLRDHIVEMCKPTHPNNVIKAYRLQKVVHPMPVACDPVKPGDLRPSVEREERAMPGWLRRSLPYIYEAIRELNSSPDTEAMSACQSKKAPLVTLLFRSSRTLDYSFPPGTRYPPQLPDSLSFQRCGFRRWHRPPPCDLSLSLAVSHSATQSLGSGTTRSESKSNSQTGAVIQQCMAHQKLQPIQPATSKPPSLQHPTKPHLKRPLRPQPSQKPLQVILNLPAPVAAAVLCPAPSTRVLASRLSHSAPLAKDLVTRKCSMFANLRRLPRLLPAPPPNNKNPPQTNLNTVTPNSGANHLLLPHMSSRTASTITETQTSVSTMTPIEQFKNKSSRTSRRVTEKRKSSLKSEGQPQPSASPEPPALDQALTPDDYVTVIMEKEEVVKEEGGDEEDEREEKDDCGREDGDGGDFGMPLLALSESSASPTGSVDSVNPTEESEEGQEITLTLSPGPSDMGDGGWEGEEGRENRDQEIEEVLSPASEESMLSVPELQETMEKLSWLASGGRSDDSEEGERSGTPSGCHSSSPNPSSSRDEQHHTGEVGSKGRSKSPPILYDDDDLLDSDPLREKKEIAFAQNYLNRVCHALQEVPGRVEEFLEVLYEFEQDGDEHTSVELFTRLKHVLNEWPELLRDFAAFLHPEQAQECGLLAEQQAFERSRRFLRQLELSFGENSSHYRKIVSILQGGPTLSPAGIKEVKAQIANLLRGHSRLQGEFWVFFNELHLRPSLQCQTENRGCGDVTNTNSTSQKSSAANKPKRCQGTKTPKATQVREDEADKEKEGDHYVLSEHSVCAKNISLTPSGEKVILWTREADRAILTACQQKGAKKITFQAVSAQLGNKTANEVCDRFQDLMRLFRSSTQRVCSDEEVSDTEQPTSSREPDPD
ncbi:GON-4-like protein isoform X2 [Coregonus clupeaformis]|uniref:GON-4-like protein isoform X2 n=1 Tax=Coregonus clupeaformis TaxID=59861 RepID=UPI001E1C6F2E|nr:GON-4-like protein isoform X2 [Coregonus clupeaformis]